MIRLSADDTRRLGRLRDAWLAERGDPGPVRRVVASWIEKICASLRYKRHVRKMIRALWSEHLPHWTAVYEDHLEERHEEGYAGQEAEDLALQDLKTEFFTTLEARLAQELDANIVWAFIANPAWRAILEEHDGRLFLKLVRGLRATLALLRPSVPQLTVAEDALAEAVQGLLAAVRLPEDESDPESPSSSSSQRAPLPQAERSPAPVRGPARSELPAEEGLPSTAEASSAVLDASWQTISSEAEEEEGEPDTEEEEGEEGEESPTVIKASPAEAPQRAPFAAAEPASPEASAEEAKSRLQRLRLPRPHGLSLSLRSEEG